ncbi:M3 family metallopeptidase [Urechidicola vernalis]|uniref:M3 family metallopeptidase n=1 Tax=Urechidicola vernalis TaxID=3075600 RepID=A0ABU2Y5H8_9FLAO|nr:M3 family metallopeptidase [Urechidicola sp. P050]MDT0553020.1 M3 family metallopeptidase [Urechidicola sp. P050]
MNNPLVSEFNTPFRTAPFSKIKSEHFEPAIKQGIAMAKEDIDAITKTIDEPSFTNTIEALEFSGMQLKRITSVFFNLNSAETNEDIQKIAQIVSPLLTEFANDIRLNETLFNRVSTIFKIKETLNLTVEQNTLLTNQYKMFVRNGANLNEDEKSQLRTIDTRLSKLSLKFGEHVLADTNSFELHITNKEELSGLPEGTKEAAKLTAKEKNKKGWIFTLDYPSYVPFMTYSENRSLRKRLAIAFGAKGFQNNENNNENIVLEIVKLRHQRANLLGYKSHAHFVIEERMAQNPETVSSFLNELLDKASPAAKDEFDQLSEFAKNNDQIETLEKWDSAYYSEKLKKELLDLDEEQLKPYFKLENVLNGVFTVSNKLFDLKFEEDKMIDTYHKDVKTYKVFDSSSNFVAIFYADFFPRAGKRNGAWMTSFKDQWIKNGENSRPHISIVCNFTKPTDSKPSLLTFNEVTTLFHEFGHALHGMLANTVYPSLSGTSVHWDFVELPSQILENWCYEKEALDLFAKHYETGESIPMELIDKIKKASNFLEGIATLRQLSFGLLDMGWHGNDPSTINSVKEFESNAFKNTNLYPEVSKNCMSTAFSHIFQGGYSSGYYSYKWAEVLDADAFDYFKSNGVFNKEIALSFKENILSKGGTENPMSLYKRFRGKEPNSDALLKRAGLLKKH